MQVATYTTIRANLAKAMEQVCTDHDAIIITRNREPSAVLMSLDDYNALEETAYLLRSPRNAARLAESIEQLEAGKGSKRNLDP